MRPNSTWAWPGTKPSNIAELKKMLRDLVENQDELSAEDKAQVNTLIEGIMRLRRSREPLS